MKRNYEIEAEVFRVIRANTHKSKTAIFDALTKELPDITLDELVTALKNLLK
jgi:hypothetical protein